MDKCPVCGYSEKLTQQQIQNTFNHYKNERGEMTVMNSMESEITNSAGVVWKICQKDGSPIPKPNVIERKPIQPSAQQVAPVAPTPELKVQSTVPNPTAQLAASKEQNTPKQA